MSGIIGGAGIKSGVIVPPIVGCRVQPAGGGNVTLAAGENTFGWTATGTSAAIKGCFIKHIKFGTGSPGTTVFSGDQTGMITILYGGLYYIHCDVRIENNPTAGNLQMEINEGTHVAQRMHTEAWDHYPYGHSTNRGCLHLIPGDTLRFHVSCAGATMQGYTDQLNYLHIMRMS